MAYGPSPFDRSEAEPLGASVEWLTGALLGDLAVGICVVAIAFVGLAMLQGRIDLRMGVRVILGCFILLGAPSIAAGLSDSTVAVVELPPAAFAESTEREDLPPSNYSPYARASLRRDRR